MYKRYLAAVLIIFAVIGAVVYARAHAEASPINVHAVPMKNISIGKIRLSVEVASTDAEREQGLSDRASLRDGTGMLFVFSKVDSYGFWMKDMHFSIDIVWINSDGVIAGIDKNVSPDTYPAAFYPPSPVPYVLEVPAGFADSHGVAVGSAVSGI